MEQELAGLSGDVYLCEEYDPGVLDALVSDFAETHAVRVVLFTALEGLQCGFDFGEVEWCIWHPYRLYILGDVTAASAMAALDMVAQGHVRIPLRGAVPRIDNLLLKRGTNPRPLIELGMGWVLGAKQQ